MDTTQMLLSSVLYRFDSVFFSNVYAAERLDLDPPSCWQDGYRDTLSKMSQEHEVSNAALVLICVYFVSSLCAFLLPLNCAKEPLQLYTAFLCV